MISVLLPTRLRPRQLNDSLASLRTTAATDAWEVLIIVDPDDPAATAEGDTRWALVNGGHIYQRVFVAPERYGYRQLHLYYNALAEQARGDWLFLWNDDAEMTTNGWDRIVESHQPNVVLSPDNIHRPIPAFPIVPKRFVQALGHFSLGPHNDIWWQEIAEALGILEWIDVRVEHHRPDLTGHAADSVHEERGHWLREQYDELADELQQDVETIKELLPTR